MVTKADSLDLGRALFPTQRILPLYGGLTVHSVTRRERMVLYISCRPGHLTGFIWNFNIPRQHEKVPSGNKETIGKMKGNKIEGFYCVAPLKKKKKTSVPLQCLFLTHHCLQNRNKSLSLAVKLYFSLLHAASQITLLLSLWVDLCANRSPSTAFWIPHILPWVGAFLGSHLLLLGSPCFSTSEGSACMLQFLFCPQRLAESQIYTNPVLLYV